MEKLLQWLLQRDYVKMGNFLKLIYEMVFENEYILGFVLEMFEEILLIVMQINETFLNQMKRI
jgi:hypothetical protein